MIADIKRSQQRRLLVATVLCGVGIALFVVSTAYGMEIAIAFTDMILAHRINPLTWTSIVGQIGFMWVGGLTFLFAKQWRDAIKDEIRKWNT